LPELASRAGTYQRQPTGYRAFIPAPLPPQPPVTLRAELQRLLSQADLALGRLDGSIQTLPNPDLFVFMYVLVPTTCAKAWSPHFVLASSVASA
jgi:hypothetical protein